MASRRRSRNGSGESPKTPASPDKEDDKTPSVDTWPIVGIGASAGGLEALTELLQYLPDSTGMGFVVVQHLDPHHPSVLAELLSNQTRMSVVEATQGAKVLPNHVYIIPPNRTMSIQNGVLHLSARSHNIRHLPIDHFLTSLAEDRKTRAIGVILSGGASDGTIGLESIKAEAGITFAQDKTAKFDSMPRSAISAAAVDFVLPPAVIARELSAIAKSFYLGPQVETPVSDGPELQKIFSKLREQVGVDFVHYKAATIHRRVARRLAVNHLNNLQAYLTLLEQNPRELETLFDDFLITVTDFFRDPEVYNALAKTVFPLITRHLNRDEPIRIWVSGCSTGKEAYSIAISLIEFLEQTGQSFPVQLFATDVSERVIEAARTGKYPKDIEASVSPERLARFFIKLEDGYQVAPIIREICVFSRQDVTTDPPLARMHLISCRNLLIYFGPVLQRRVLAAFSYALRKDGCLLLGASESPNVLADHFDTLDVKHKIYKRNLQASPFFELPLRSPVFKAAENTTQAVRVDEASILDMKADRLLLAEYAPSGFLLDARLQIVKFRGEVGPFLSPAAGDPNLDALKLVREEIAAPLQTALKEARKTAAIVRKERLQLRRNGNFEEINLVVRPISDPGMEQHFLVLFERALPQAGAGEPPRVLKSAGKPEENGTYHDLEIELESTRTHMQRLIEELRSANEEAQSVNEELQSTNEELQTSKEELQSSNEELNTTNDEMQSRNRALSQANSDLINVLGSIQTPIILLGKELQIRRYTPVSEKMLNVIPTDIGRPITNLRTELDFPDLEELLKRVVRWGAPEEREVRDLNGRYYSLRAHPYRTAESRIEGVVLQLVDIDQLKRTLAEVENARDFAEAIIATVREPLLVLDHTLRVKTANHSFYETFRVSEEQTLNRSIYELGNRQWNLPKLRQTLDALRQGSTEYFADMEMELDFEAIGRRVFHVTARTVARETEEKLILVALEDYTDRKRAAEARYRRLFETAKDAIVVIDAETGEITDVNPFALELFGCQRSDLVGKYFWESAPLSEMPEAKRLLELLREQEVMRFPSLSLRCQDGRKIETEVIGNMYQEGSARVIQFNIRDITERVQFQHQLQQTAKLESLGVLAGGIAHDFNNLLVGIMGNASLALSSAPPSTPYQQALKEVVEASHRAADLTKQMLAYAGKGRFEVRPIDISELVKDISSLLRTSAPKSVELEYDLAADLPLVAADATQIQQVIMNMVINGAEAIGEGRRGHVRITTRKEHLQAKEIRRHYSSEKLRPGAYVALEISDSGAGMDEAVKAKIFDPFFTTKFTGRGLGLAAIQGIVRGHQGAIRVTSAPGRGATFRVLLPATEQARRVSKPSETTAPDLRGSGLVLVVDDEQIVLRMAKSALERYGYEVITAENGEIALQVIERRGPELNFVILDLTMPVMGGAEALPRITEMRPDLPVLLASGYDAAEAMVRFGSSEGAGFIQKPFTVEKLATVVKTTLGRDH